MFTISFQSQNIHIDNTSPFFFIAGPCAIEGRTQALETASALKEIFTHLKIPFLYKSSFDKANRSSISSFRGIGMEEGSVSNALYLACTVRRRKGLGFWLELRMCVAIR